MTKRTITYIQDPGHGWLSVSHKDIVALGIADKITSYSYMNATRAFLEEDCDASMFLDAAKAAGWTVTIKKSYVDKTAIRSMGGYRKHWIDNPWAVGSLLSVYAGKGRPRTLFSVTDKTAKGWIIRSVSGGQYRLPLSNPFLRIYPPE